jgi:hypothetical protein
MRGVGSDLRQASGGGGAPWCRQLSAFTASPQLAGLLLTDCCSAMRDLPLSKRPERAILDGQLPGIGGKSVLNVGRKPTNA